ncbi:PAS domain S-box protein [Antarcticibacterium arcticum]|uniref:histidine kinase n=1 Tax=Antarcticibacterium arcticum TaxID=2585771 RepID=A0A5B8YLT8_9FLAO|nr:PAS domain S-box protein [Antarcticibacterium arcticum]QED38208.1 PAS domain S-box protein [Antarcticibacterium arcticum]
MQQNNSGIVRITRYLGKPLVCGLLTFLFFLILGSFILWQRYQILKEAEQREMANLIGFIENNIDHALKNSHTAALNLALLVESDGSISAFDEVAPGLLKNYPLLDAVQMVPGGIISMVYPKEKNLEVLDYNILEDPAVNREAFRAMHEKQMYFAGPFELRQGGLAVVGRLPVYIQNEFWGFSAVIIKLESLLEEAGLEKLGGDKYDFQFSKVDVKTGKETYFLPPLSEMSGYYTEHISFPDGDWKVYIALKEPGEVFYSLLPIGFFMLLLAGWLGWAMTNLLKQPEKLQALVKMQAGELSYNELKFRTIFNQAAIGMARVNSITGSFLETNLRFQQLFGYTPSEIKELNIVEVTHPDDMQEDLDKMKMLRQGVVREYSMQKRIRRKDGELRWVNLTVSPLWGDGETPTTHIAIIEDIHDKKTAETHLKESYEMVMEQNKRLLNFSYIVSHNLRSHSSNIESILNLYEETGDPEERKNYMRMLEKVSAALNQTLYDLNEVVSIQTNLDLTVQDLKVKDYLEETLGLLKVEIEKRNARIYTNVPEEMVVKFNAAYMESILLNLITNSLRYSSPHRDPEIHISGKKVENEWMLEVKDNGIGIDLKRNRDKLFGLYKTFSNRPNSRGVGLFITKNQIDAMNGRIEVESKVDAGASFKVYFK